MSPEAIDGHVTAVPVGIRKTTLDLVGAASWKSAQECVPPRKIDQLPEHRQNTAGTRKNTIR
ncbi:hypothetical protein E4N62_38055 [Streptomyces sp. MNU76]|uniref:hypothetical protein n=1 Tax=Streptomyces sp. MNU76 TaxID=2560026 RepID=UPI001E3B11A9|nr:hypothetical protein [Streptomyces sp. MNU76]MCC9710538.1 hypothetical protein [Streptomyces sp. MNU76]